MRAVRAIGARLPARERVALGCQHELEGEQLAQGRAREPREPAVEARAERADPDHRLDADHAQPRALEQLPRVGQREPAQVRAVEDPLLAEGPAAADDELPEGLEE